MYNMDIVYSYFSNLKESFFVGDEKKSDFEIFRMGYESCLKEIERKKALKTKRKSKKIVMTDFLCDTSYLKYKRRFLTGVYHDNGHQVITNGRYMVVHNASYSSELEGKIIDRNNLQIEGTFPNWQTVIPKDDSLIETQGLTSKDVKIICSQFKTNSLSKLDALSPIGLKVEGQALGFSILILKMLNKFLNCYPNAIFYRHKKDLTKSWKILDKESGDFFLFMPIEISAISNCGYKFENQIVTENA